MQTFNITDSETGMNIRVRGETAPTEADMPQLFEAAKRNASSQLAEGLYKQDSEFRTLDKAQQRERVQKLSAAALGTSVDNVDVDSGMGLWERTKLDMLRDDQSRMDYLEKKFGAENVAALNIGGKPKMFYRDPKTNKMTMVDEMGASLADFTADIAGEAVTTAGAVGGAIAGTVLAPGVGTVAGATAGAALGGFVTGVAQDVASEVATGQDVDLGDIATQRGIEAAIGVPIDLATAGVGKVFSRGIAGRGARNLISEFDTAASRVDNLLAKEAESLPKVAALRTGEGSKQASQIAAARPSSKLAKELQSVRDRIGTLRESLEGRGSAGVSADEFNAISEKIAQNYRTIVDEVEGVDKALAAELRDQASRKMQKLAAPKVSEMDVGQRLQGILKEAEGVAGQVNDRNWAELDAMAQQMGVGISGKQVARSIRQTTKEMSPLVNKELSKLADEVADIDNISFTDLRGYISRIQDTVPDKQAGFKTAQQVAIAAGERVRNLRDKIAGQAGREFQDQYDKTIRYYLDDYLNFKRQAVGGALKEASGAMTQPELAVRGILSNASGIRSALRAARQAGQGQEKALRNELRDLYMNRIGLAGDGVDLKSVDFNDDIVRELWGSRQLRELKNLQSRIAQSKIDINEVDPVDVNRYLNAMSNDERSRIYKMMRQKQVRGKQVDSLLNSKLVQKLLPKKSRQTGDWLEPDFTGIDLAQFSENFVNAPTTQVKQAMEALKKQQNPSGLQAFRQSYVGNLFDRFSSGAQVDRFGNPLWNPKAFDKAMKKGRIRQNALEVLGKEGVDDLMAANRVLLEASETTGGQVAQIFQPRYSLTSGGLQLYGVGNLIGGLRGKALAWAYGNRLGATLMRFLTNPGSDEATEKVLKKLLPALMTSSGGLKAAAIQSEFDPEFAEAIAPLYGSQN